MATTQSFARKAILRQGLISGIVVLFVFIGYGTFRYPLLIREGGIGNIALPVFLLLLYGAAVLWGTQKPNPTHHLALHTGTLLGLAVGATFVATISVENFTDFNDQVMPLTTLGFMLLIFVLFTIAGWCGTVASGQLRWGLFASVWSSLLSVLIALLFGFAINILFTQRLEYNLMASAEYRRSGVHDLETFTFYNTLDSASSHLLEAPIIALACGGVGGLIGKELSRLRKGFL